MDFNVKKLASDAGVFFTRAVQFTEEKLGQAEKTELDPHLENLITRADGTKNWTEKILRQTEVLLQPNPIDHTGARIEEFIYDKLDKKLPSRTTNAELLGQYMLEAANEFGPGTPYGSTLITVAEYQKRLGGAEREFLHTSAINFLSPLRNFLEGDWRTISKERRLLENRRLDLDICKARVKKAKQAEAKAAEQLHGPGKMHGYRWMFTKCQENGLKVKKEEVRLILAKLDPEGSAFRQQRRLYRRQYFSKRPNHIWHIDSYDKLKPFGVCINGCIDGFSRKVIWLNAYKTSSDPKVIGGYFVEALETLGKCPKLVCTDRGTENACAELSMVLNIVY
ncbi:endophilin-B2-like isoform X8 [Acanthochromis polyacanthus]|uniref:endophilin-B2-like isoform X8 n=1 Tax=Acanthochromis polyacanthus TaxID=80966 RepID=UPI002234C762|nr:endophilin-B2-like isoform X8 [Acanthochromis polyacanthus]